MQLSRAVDETNFEEAKDYARKAKNSLDLASMTAMDCGCGNLGIELNKTIVLARRARDASDIREFTKNINSAVTIYNSSLNLAKTCRQLR